MLIPCLHCGLRDESEFTYGAEAAVRYPERPADVSDREWAAFLFVRANPRGELRERWQHSGGCRRWFELTRDTVTNELRPPTGAPR
jgi:heterotetrameric sarcosine oxidase delta subunit